jgi:hypothetical protein
MSNPMAAPVGAGAAWKALRQRKANEIVAMEEVSTKRVEPMNARLGEAGDYAHIAERA